MTDLSMDFLEKFAMAGNKADVLRELTPHTPLYTFVELMIALQDSSRAPADLEKAVKAFGKGTARDEHKEAVELRFLLSQLSAARENPEEVKRLARELNDLFLHYTFEAANPFQSEFRSDLQQTQGARPPSALTDSDRKSLGLEEALRKVVADNSLASLHPDYADQVDLAKLDYKRHFSLITQVLLQSPRLADRPNLLPTLQELLKHPDAVEFVASSIWPRLSIQAKEALLTKDSPLGHRARLWTELARVKFDLDRLQAERSEPAELLAALEKVAELFAKMPAPFAQFRRAVRLWSLAEKVRQDTVTKGDLLEYLRDPVATEQAVFGRDIAAKLTDKRRKGNENVETPTLWPLREQETVRKALEQVLRGASSYTDLAEFVDRNLAGRIFFEQKLLQGHEASGAKDHLGETGLQQLFQEKRLRFEESNRRQFGRDERVVVSLEVKNVPKLTVRLFEVNTLALLLETSGSDFELVDTAGLVPSAELQFAYSHSPMVAHRETFEFQTIQTTSRGVFIVDFLGGDLKTRSVIAKGGLTLIHDGQGSRTATILDHDGQACSGVRTGLHIQGAFFPAKGDQGEITIPSAVAPGSWQAVAVHDGFASRVTLTLQAPDPRLALHVLYNSEAFQPGNTVTFVLEPKLLLHGRAADPAQLRRAAAVVTTVDEQGVANSTPFPGLKPRAGEDLTVCLIFPPRVRSITVEFSAEFVEGERLTASKAIAVTTDAPDNVQSVVFQKRAGGSLVVRVVGRNGEPRRNQVVNLKIRPRFLKTPRSFTLVTDDQGTVELGQIPDLELVEAVAGAANSAFQEAEDVQRGYPQTIDVREGEPVALPINSELDRVSLGKVRCGCEVEDLTKTGLKREVNTLTVLPLTQGAYALRINAHGIAINVHRGEYAQKTRLLKTRDAVLALPGDPASWFQAKRETPKEWEVRLWAGRPDLKARLLTFNYLPAELQDIFDDARQWTGSDGRLASDAASFPARTPENVFSDSIFLGDELAYVYSRRGQESFLGNTLDKPGVLLKRRRLGETQEVEQVARAGQTDLKRKEASTTPYLAASMYSAPPPPKPAPMCMAGLGEGRRPGTGRPGSGKVALKEYLATPGTLVTGLRPESGLLRIPKTLTASFAFSFLSVSDGACSALIPLESDARPVPLRDVSLPTCRKEGFIYAFGRTVRVVPGGRPVEIPNVQNTQLCMVLSLSDYWETLLTLAPHLRPAAAEWEFLKTWGSLEPMEKLRKYDQFASHELNLFVALKDRQFFEGVVRPHLRNKREKNTVDHFLLGDAAAIADGATLVAAQALPLLERVLLAGLCRETAPGLGEALLAHARGYLAVNRLSSDERTRRFETLMNVNAEGHATFKPQVQARGLEDDGVVFGEAAPRSERKKYGVSSRVLPRGGSMRDFSKEEKTKSLSRRFRGFEAAEANEPTCEADEEEVDGREQEVFAAAQKTSEFDERQYFDTPRSGKPPTEFLAGLLEHLLRAPSPRGFVSTEFLSGLDTLNDLLTALAFTDLPFEKTEVASNVIGTTLTLGAPADFLLLVKEVIERPGERADLEVLCSQKVFDPADPVVPDDEDPEVFYDKPVEEFVAGRPYACRVAVSNSNATRARVTLILEVPQGSIPLDSAEALRIKELSLAPLTSQVVECRFYFPRAGQFGLFPATVVKGDRIVASARRPPDFAVKAEPSARGMRTIADVLAHGSVTDIIEFLRTKNLLNPSVFRLAQVYWLLSNREFYEGAVSLCQDKGVFDETLWSYSVLHGDYPRLRVLLQLRADRDNFFPRLAYFACDALRVDRFRLREYHPLINPRAHALGGASTNIANTAFKTTYTEFLRYLFQKPRPTADDLALLVAYLVAQDRLGGAQQLVQRLSGRESELRGRLQFDYMAGFLAFASGPSGFAKAKALCERYLTYPVLSWRNLFVEMANQLAEFEETTESKTDRRPEGELLNKAKAAGASSLSASLEGGVVKLATSRVAGVVLRFYKVELEAVFSLNPFDFLTPKQFAFVAPFLSLSVATPVSEKVSVTPVELPSGLAAENLFIEVRSADERLRHSEWLAHLPFGLQCVITREFGVLKVVDPADSRPVSRVYVKCFARHRDGSSRFYKDGYTDLRGSFDYVSLNTDRLDDIRSFAIFVCSPDHGAKVFVEDPPSRLGAREGQAKQLLSAGWARARQDAVAQKRLDNANPYECLF